MKKIIENFEEYLGGIFFALMLIILTCQIFFRQVLNMPLLWSEELARLLFVYTAILGVVLGIKHNQHVAIELLIEKAPPKTIKLLCLIKNILIFLVIIAIFLIGIQVTLRKIPLELISLKISSVYLYGALPIGAILMMVRFLENLYKNMKNKQ